MRLINADEAIKKAECYNWDTTAINNAPTVDAEPVRHGKWRFVNCATGLRCQCSECLHWVDVGTDRNYCPNCGAKLADEHGNPCDDCQEFDCYGCKYAERKEE